MSRVIFSRKDEQVLIPTGPGALEKCLLKYGKLPPVSILIKPLNPNKPQFNLDRFLSYKFSNSILIPVDTFEFQFLLDEEEVVEIPVQCGDIIEIRANNVTVCTGFVDEVDVETDSDRGTTVNIRGRDVLAQLEDQDALSIESSTNSIKAFPVFAKQATVSQVFNLLRENTKIPSGLITRSATKKPFLFATQPGESKLSALLRFLESLNLMVWTNSDGRVIIGKPNMWAEAKSALFLKRKERTSNLLSIRSTRAETQIPNMCLPIWNAQEGAAVISNENIIYNRNRGPTRLRKYGYRVLKSVVVSTPEGSSPQDLDEVNVISRVGGANLLQAYAKREMARANLKELSVQIQMIGHYNELAEPFTIDQVYRIQYDIDGIDEDMYLYQVEYSFSEDRSQITNLFFCRQLALVSDIKVLPEGS